MVSFRAGLIARSAFDAAAIDPTPLTLHALPGAFVLTGEDMTPTAGYLMPAGTGAIVLGDPGTTQMIPPALPLSVVSQVNGASGGTSLALPALSVQAGDIVYVIVLANSAPTTGVSGPTLGAFAQRGSGGTVTGWWKLATSTASEVITLVGPSTSYFAARAFTIRNAKTGAPFDTNPSFPKTTGFGAPADPQAVTLASPNAIVVAGWRLAGGDANAGSGYTRLPVAAVGDFVMCEYQIFTSNGAKSVTVGSPDTGTTAQGFIDAIVAGP